MKEILKFILVFCISAALDTCWTFAINYTTEKKKYPAALWTALGYLLASLNVIAYVSDPKLIVAVVVGATAGCFLTVKYLK